MSQFNEDKVGAPSDPTQKTLTNFIISGDASKKSMGDHNSLGSEISDHHFMNETENGFSTDTHETCHFKFGGLLDSNYLDDNNHTESNNVGEMERVLESLHNGTAEKVSLKTRLKFELRHAMSYL